MDTTLLVVRDLAELLTLQCGVISRSQLQGCGISETAIRRRLRRRELVVVVPGVYVNHTGELTWSQRAWVAVLALAPAALCHHSVLRVDDGPGRAEGSGLIHVAVDRDRSPTAPPGVRLHRLTDLDSKVAWHRSPPCVRIEHAVLDVAAESRRDIDAIAVLADAVQSRRTTAVRLLATLGTRHRIARRDLLEAVLRDVAEGACSVLEQAYLARVERLHGLPQGERQAVERGRNTVYRDVRYAAQRVVVELDGRLFHDSARARDADLERDLDAAVDGEVTVRLGWGQVFGRACSTAAKMGEVLGRRGWDGQLGTCPACATSSLRYAAAIS